MTETNCWLAGVTFVIDGKMSRSICFVTIGCKLNQFETEQMRESVQARDWLVVDPWQKADVYVINTCTVTAKSDYRSRQAIRRAIRVNPDAVVIATGCYAQVAADEVRSIKGVDLVLGNSKKDLIADYIDLGKQIEPIVDVEDIDQISCLKSVGRLTGFGSYTRAFVKIQDGCNNRCAYCAVPFARGRSRSKPPGEIEVEIKELTSAGYKEIVLTGVHLGSYGKDLSKPISLADLLVRLSRIETLERIRLSSIEPNDFTKELIEVVADPSNKVCDHFHIPLQSGDDNVLRLMGRQYSVGYYRQLIDQIRSHLPNCGIGADVMVGHPGETEVAFNNTLALVESLPFSYLHVFCFSPRPKTAASVMPDQVPVEEKKLRSSMLRQLGKTKSLRFRASLKGKKLQALTLKKVQSGYTCSLSSNYVKAYIKGSLDVNQMIDVNVIAPLLDGVLAERQER